MSAHDEEAVKRDEPVSPGGGPRHRGRTAPSIWERLEGTPKQAPLLTHDKIAHAAMYIADADGLEAVSMRRLAEHLGVATMTLYRYVSSKDDVFGLMLNAAYGEVPLPSDASANWREVARAVAVELRQMHLRHIWASQVQAYTASGFAPNVLAVNETVLASLVSLGLSTDDMMAMFGTIMAYVEGTVAEQVAMRAYLRRKGFTSEADFQKAFPEAFAPHVTWIFGQADKYPTVLRLMFSGYDEDYDRSFNFGLDCVLDGIGGRLGI